MMTVDIFSAPIFRGKALKMLPVSVVGECFLADVFNPVQEVPFHSVC